MKDIINIPQHELLQLYSKLLINELKSELKNFKTELVIANNIAKIINNSSSVYLIGEHLESDRYMKTFEISIDMFMSMPDMDKIKPEIENLDDSEIIISEQSIQKLGNEIKDFIIDKLKPIADAVLIREQYDCVPNWFSGYLKLKIVAKLLVSTIKMEDVIKMSIAGSIQSSGEIDFRPEESLPEDYYSFLDDNMKNKKASETATAPLYINEDGTVFTAHDLVNGSGYLPNGKKPSKYKPYSLSERVGSESFGKANKNNEK